ncbi:MAG: hypothetical protein ABR950_05910 [Candidatus Dormibacteria bacterium]
MATHVRKNIMLPATLDAELRELSRRRQTSQSGLIAHLVRLGLASERSDEDPLLRYIGVLAGPPDLSATVDDTVYGR